MRKEVISRGPNVLNPYLYKASSHSAGYGNPPPNGAQRNPTSPIRRVSRLYGLGAPIGPWQPSEIRRF